MDGLMTEIQKIPPITRFLCGSSLAVTLSVLTGIISPYSVFFTKDLVFGKLQIWRLWSSFFMGGGGINYIFEFAMLYRTSNELELDVFKRRSADYLWQLLFASGSIIALSTPLKSFLFSRPLLICLTYISAAHVPPGAQSSLMGLVTYPAKYMPYMMIGLDLLMGGTSAAAQGIVGALVGHLWWWGVWGSGQGQGQQGQGQHGQGHGQGAGRGVLEEWSRAPAWLKGLIGEHGQGNVGGGGGGRGAAPGGGGGVQVIPPRRTIPIGPSRSGAGAGAANTSTTSGTRNWGAGRRLGNE